jgi:hypothetical protein
MSIFEYAVLRAVPRVQRGEYVNVGVVLYCQELDFLGALAHIDEARLRSLDHNVDLAAVDEALDAVCRTCEGEGPAGATSLGQRFRWLTAPRSTVLQAGPVHGGVTDDPAGQLRHLLDSLVR